MPAVFRLGHCMVAPAGTAPVAVEYTCPPWLSSHVEAATARKTVDLTNYPPALRTPLRAFMKRAGALLTEMLLPEDGAALVHLVLLESLDPNAFMLNSTSGEKVVGITLGLIATLECDEELAFILGHELEHAHSQLQKEVEDRRQAGRRVEALLLKRSVESEVDVKSVHRMVVKGKNPHAAVDWLRRMEAQYGDLPGLTHPMYRTRSNAVEAAIAANVRLRGEGGAHRLDQSPRSHVVLGNVRAAVFGGDRVERFLFEKVESLLTPAGMADAYFEAVRDNSRAAFPTERPAADISGETQTVFEQCFARRWQDIAALLPEAFDAAKKVELQLRLAKNLHEEFERAKRQWLGDAFMPNNPEQFEALVLLEKRRYPIAVPNLLEVLQKRDQLTENLAQAAGTPDAVRFAHYYDGVQAELDRLEASIPAARALFEPGDALDHFVAEGYHTCDRHAFEPKHWLHSDRFLSALHAAGLRIRCIHDLVAQAGKSEAALRAQGQVRAVLLATDLAGFALAYRSVDARDLSVTEKRQILQKAQDLFAAAPARARGAHGVAHLLFSQLSPYYAQDLPQETHACAVAVMTKILTECAGEGDLESVGTLLQSALPFLGGEAEGCICTFQDKTMAVWLAALGGTRELSAALHVIAKLGKQVRGYSRDAMAFSAYRGAVPLAKQLAQPLGALARLDDVTAAQLEMLIYVHAPALMPAAMGPTELAVLRERFIALCTDRNLRATFARSFEFYAVMYVFSQSFAAQDTEERALRSDNDRLTECRRLLFEMPEGEQKTREKPLIEEEAHGVYVRLQAIAARKMSGLYDLLVATPGVWRFGYKDKGEWPIGGSFFEPVQDLREYLLQRLTQERPWDLASAALLIRSRPYLDESSGQFLATCFQWHVQTAGSLEAATYQFWTAVDDARIAPTYHQQHGLGDFVASQYCTKSAGDHAEWQLTDLTTFEAYRRGVARFVGEFQDADRPKAKYLKQEVSGASVPDEHAGYPPFEMGLRVNWEPVRNFWKEADNYTRLPVATVAAAFLAYVTEKDTFFADEATGEVMAHLWAHRADPAVEKVLMHPQMVRAAFYQSDKVRLAQWQLEKIPGLTDICEADDLDQASLPGRTEIRELTRQCHTCLQQQFPKPTPASYEVLQWVEEQLLPSEAETELLSELRLTENNWTKSEGLYGIDAPDALERGLKTAAERTELIRYLIGVTRTPPVLTNYRPEHVERFKSFYLENGELFRTLVMQALIGRAAEMMNASKTYPMVRALILDGAVGDVALEAVFDTYMEVLPGGERKLLLANAMAVMDPTRGGRLSFRRLLEAAGPLGARAAQGLVTSGVVTGELRQDLMTSFDAILSPTREQIYRQLKAAFGPAYDDIVAVGRIRGSGSLNYVVEVWLQTPAGIRRVAVRIQKEHVQGMIQNEYQVWQEVTQRLVRHAHPRAQRYGRLMQGLLREAYQSLRPDGVELDLAQERARYEQARAAYERAAPHPDTEYRVDVARPILELQQRIQPEWQSRVSVYEYVAATRWDALADAGRRRALAGQVVDAELAALQGGTFDPDAHKGNWLIDGTDARLVRVDYAQLVEVAAAGCAYFKQLLRLLLNPSGGAQLQTHLQQHFSAVFAVDEPPAALDAALAHVFAASEMPTDPMERLLCIQNQLELFFVDQGHPTELRFRDAVSKPLGLFLRLNLYRDYLGDPAYYAKLARFLVS